jgi:hypothetical protein
VLVCLLSVIAAWPRSKRSAVVDGGRRVYLSPKVGFIVLSLVVGRIGFHGGLRLIDIQLHAKFQEIGRAVPEICPWLLVAGDLLYKKVAPGDSAKALYETETHSKCNRPVSCSVICFLFT